MPRLMLWKRPGNGGKDVAMDVLARRNLVEQILERWAYRDPRDGGTEGTGLASQFAISHVRCDQE